MIRVYRYTLVPRRALNARTTLAPRTGALLQVDGGFADVHPWPELGDAPLDIQLSLLARGETTPLTRASLRLASRDAEARRKGVSLFDGKVIPLSHWSGIDPPPGFDTIKVKGDARFDPSSLPPDVRVRIDFNATLDEDSFMKMALPRERIDFVEDPTPYDPERWIDLRRRTGLRLALDRRIDTAGVDVLVVKPALLADFPDVDREIVVTSYMDHPIGQFGAALIAAEKSAEHGAAISSRCGLFTHVLYESDAFIDRVRANGARLLPPAGTGIGFDDLLAALPWKRLTP